MEEIVSRFLCLSLILASICAILFLLLLFSFILSVLLLLLFFCRLGVGWWEGDLVFVGFFHETCKEIIQNTGVNIGWRKIPFQL